MQNDCGFTARTSKKNRPTSFKAICFKLKNNNPNKAGFGLIEVMIVATVVALICIAIIAALDGLRLEIKKQRLTNSLQMIKNNIEQILTSKVSWDNTINANPNMLCIKNQVACDGSVLPGNYVKNPTRLPPLPSPVSNEYEGYYMDDTNSEIVIRDGADAGGQIFYDGRRSTNTSGFTEAGERCVGFSYPPAPGNDACPIGYVINWRALTNGRNPKITIIARLIFNPSNNHPLKKVINSNLNNNAPTISNDAIVVRTRDETRPTFTMTFGKNIPAGAGSCNASSTFGVCTIASAPNSSAILSGMSTGGAFGNSDPYLIANAPAILPVDYFNVQYAGKYHCVIKAFTYQSGSSSIWLADKSSPSVRLLTQTSDSSSYSLTLGSLTEITGQGYVNLQTSSNYSIYQKCTTNANTCGRGYAMTNGDNIMASLTCTLAEDQN